MADKHSSVKGQYFLVHAIIIWTFIATTSRSLRSPNGFAEAHWLLNYQFGFIRRGLIGSICSLFSEAFNVQMTPAAISVLSTITLYGMSLAFLFVFFRMIHRHQNKMDTTILGIIFASSPFIVLNAHYFGYFDAVLYILTIGSVMMIFKRRLVLSEFFSSIAILVHESYLVVGMPVIFLAALVTKQLEAERKTHRISTALAIAVPVGVFLLMPLCQRLTTDTSALRAQIAERLISFGFVSLRGIFVAEFQTTSFIEYFQLQHVNFFKNLFYPPVAASIGPALITILVFIHLAFHIRPFSRFSIGVHSIILAPLVLHTVAWDTARITSYTIGSGLMVCWILSETRKIYPIRNIFLLVALPTLIINIFGNVPLTEDRIDRFSFLYRFLLYLPPIIMVLIGIFQNLQRDGSIEFQKRD
ncbi:MAG: hypothetical protein WBM02_09175 [bacterium]